MTGANNAREVVAAAIGYLTEKYLYFLSGDESKTNDLAGTLVKPLNPRAVFSAESSHNSTEDAKRFKARDLRVPLSSNLEESGQVHCERGQGISEVCCAEQLGSAVDRRLYRDG